MRKSIGTGFKQDMETTIDYNWGDRFTTRRNLRERDVTLMHSES